FNSAMHNSQMSSFSVTSYFPQILHFIKHFLADSSLLIHDNTQYGGSGLHEQLQHCLTPFFMKDRYIMLFANLMEFRARQMDALNAWKLQSFGVTIEDVTIEEILKIQEFLNEAHIENAVITLILDIE